MKLERKTHAIRSRSYQHSAQSISATEKLMMKNSSKALLKLTFLPTGRALDASPEFLVRTYADEQSPGNATRKLSEEMNALVSEMLVQTDQQGHLKRILNKEQVLEKWQKLRKTWQKEARRQARPEKAQMLKTIATVDEQILLPSFDESIAQQGALYFLFAGLYGDYGSDKQRVVHRTLDKMLLSQGLPLKILYQLIPEEDSFQAVRIKGQGEVDEEKLDQVALNRLVRTLKDRLDMQVALRVSYQEEFVFDEDHWLERASQQIKVKIPGFYMAESKQELSMVEDG